MSSSSRSLTNQSNTNPLEFLCTNLSQRLQNLPIKLPTTLNEAYFNSENQGSIVTFASNVMTLLAWASVLSNIVGKWVFKACDVVLVTALRVSCNTILSVASAIGHLFHRFSCQPPKGSFFQKFVQMFGSYKINKEKYQRTQLLNKINEIFSPKNNFLNAFHLVILKPQDTKLLVFLTHLKINFYKTAPYGTSTSTLSFAK